MKRITIPMLMLGLSLASLLCWAAEPNPDQAKAIAEIEKIGGKVLVAETKPDPSAVLSSEQNESIARSLLQHCLELQAKADRLSTRGVTEEKFVRGAHESPGGHQPFWLRRDGNLLDISGSHTNRNGELVDQFRLVCNNDCEVVFSKPLKSAKRSLSGIVWQKELDSERLSTIRNGAKYSFPLDGYLHGADGKRAAELLLAAKDVRILGEELVDGVRCASVEGGTEYGKIALWIPQDEASIALPRKATITKGPNDLMFAGCRVSEVEGLEKSRKARMTGYSEVLDQVAVARTGKGPVCVGGRLTQTYHLTVGGDIVHTYLIKRNETELQPPFEGTDAFLTDLPDGSSVHYMDDPNSGVKYVWQGGKVEPAAVQSGLIQRAHDQADRQTIVEIEKLGGKVTIDDKSPGKSVIAVNLVGTQVIDAGLVNLKGMTTLQVVDLRETKITDAGLEHLKGLIRLKSLHLGGTQVTDSGVKKLQQALPNCQINR